MGLITCPDCGNKVSEFAVSCQECGCPVERKITCFECGALISDENNICPKCGVPLKETNTDRSSQINSNFFREGSSFNNKNKPQINWNNKKIKLLSWIFCGFALIYFLNNIFSPSPPIVVPSRSVPFSNPDPTCQSCKILGDCSAFPQCGRQSNCQWRINDITGNLEQNCSSF